MLKGLLEDKSVSRRSFLKGTAALGAMATLYGCAQEEDPLYNTDYLDHKIDDEFFTNTPVYRYGTSTHNCGGRCIIRAQVFEDKATGKHRIVRFLTDETTVAYDGTPITSNNVDEISANTTQARACSRCRAYKTRLYHPGRLKYALKQTKERGDITGFQRIPWNQAIKEIAERLKAVQGKYGAEAFHSIYACGNIASQFQGGSYTGLFASADDISPALRLLGGASAYTSDYSFHQGSYMGGYGTAYSGMINMSADPLFYSLQDGIKKHFVMWGSNIPTTRNPKAFSWTKAIEGIKANGGLIKFIGPELSEIGIAQANEWYQIRPYTDVALVLGMLYHMIDLTFDKTTGAIKQGGLDVDYLDTMVYGFFETPAYWRDTRPYTDGTTTFIGKTKNTNYGVISLQEPDDAKNWKVEEGLWYVRSNGSVGTTSVNNPDKDPVDKNEYTVTRRWINGTQCSYHSPAYTYVAAIPAGQSLSAYIMGDDDRLTKAQYSASKNYMAGQFTGKKRNTSIAKFTFTDSSNTKYQYKKEMNVAKTPKWASEITGVAEQDIKDLAEFYLRCGNSNGKERVYNEWAGGQLKQNDGTVTLYALQTLLIATKNWGYKGTGIKNNAIGVSKKTDPNQISNGDITPATWKDVPAMSCHPRISVTQWHNAIKMAFGDELKKNGYVPNIPDWVNANDKGKPKYKGVKGEVYFDDGGVKSLVNRKDITGVGKGVPKTFTVIEKITVPGKKEKQDVTCTYYDFKGNKVQDKGTLQDQSANVEYSGHRFILNSAGNIPMNQHGNTIDSARMYKALPTFGYGTHQVAQEDAFYLVTFDNFMSQSARYSDYVLPAETTWEQADFVAIENSGTLFVDAVKAGPGESISTWEFMRDLIGAHTPENLPKFTGGNKNNKEPKDVKFEDVVRDAFENTISKDKESPYYGKTWSQFLEKPISHAKPETTSADETNKIRVAYDKADKTKAFFPGVTTVDWSNECGVYGFSNNDNGQHGFAETESCPKQTGMFQVYSGTLVWRYENLYSKYHGYLTKDKQGQINKDEEGDPMVYPIPVYFNYEDHFRVAYGLDNNEQLKDRYLLTTTHDRFRAHSSQAENPYLRELTHRVVGGELYSGNDAGKYANLGTGQYNTNNIPNLNELIDNNGLPKVGQEKRASYADIWVNDEDFAGVADGTLVKVSNEIGAVVCAIRKTGRCVPGYVGLHQGCWTDLRGDLNGKPLDVGGNCNTLMPSTPSRIDHGNGTQSAMVKIEILKNA